MLHYVLHASSVSWQDQLLYAGILVAVLVLVFLGLWWRRRAARPRQGDYSALVEQGNLAQALQAQAQTPLEDATQAWQDTREAMDKVKTGVERTLALLFSLLSGLLFLISVAAVVSSVWKFPAIDGPTFALFAVLAAVSGWFARVQWRDFRGR